MQGLEKILSRAAEDARVSISQQESAHWLRCCWPCSAKS